MPNHIIFKIATTVFLWMTVCIDFCFSQENGLRLFSNSAVELTESAFRDAMFIDRDYILELDADRLLYPFLREAGLEPKAKSYPNWENSGLDGHIGGHYLTALSLMYAATGNEEVLERLQYMLDELAKVQEANEGYIGGVPNSKELWDEIAKGKINPGGFSLNNRWVPLYNIHKTYAGLRDAYEIAGIARAKKMFLDLTDWMLDVTSGLSGDQIQKMLISEHGGLNEVFADAYKMTGEEKYLDLAYKFSDLSLLQPLESGEDVLTGMHANTQIPKVIGFETIATLDDNTDYHKAASFFWDNVVNERSVAIGGNSVREHFHPTNDFSSMFTSIEGPETCNTYNMLKLSTKLFLASADEKYVDYYENSLYNHILSSQHPVKGGFVYFTPMRPGHYRVYSQPETSFWCCVGSGIENHGKYNEFIYAHSDNALYVNLFIPSVVEWREKSLKLEQATRFPDEPKSKLTFSLKQPTAVTLKIRYPRWADDFEIDVNGESIATAEQKGSYISIFRLWKDGDTLAIRFSMKITTEGAPDGSNYTAFRYGPLVLGSKMGEENLEGLFADDSRGGHRASGELMPLSETPMLIAQNENEELRKNMFQINNDLRFEYRGEVYPSDTKNLVFQPFYQIHEARYLVYIPVETKDGLEEILASRQAAAKAEKKLRAMTVDYVAPGEQQPESDHGIQMENSESGINGERHWRDATGWFSYELRNENKAGEKIRVTYFGLDSDRKFKIYVDGELLATEYFEGNLGPNFIEKDYELPKRLIESKKPKLTIRFEAEANSKTAGVYGVRLIKGEE